MNRSKNYTILEFKDAEKSTVELVPTKWLSKDRTHCLFPPCSTRSMAPKVIKFVKCLQDADKDWKYYPVERIFSTSNTYAKGEEKRKLVEVESEGFLSSDDDSSRKVSLDETQRRKYPDVPLSLQAKTAECEKTQIMFETPVGARCENPDIGTFERRKNTEENEILMRQMSNVKYIFNTILENQEMIMKKLERLDDRIGGEGEKLSNIKLPKFPISTEEELSNIEDELVSQDFRKALISDLIKIGGLHINEIVRRMMCYLVTDEVAAEFSCYGMKKKKSFIGLKIFDVIAEVVRHQLPLATNKEVTKPLSSWLRHAKERIDKKKLKC